MDAVNIKRICFVELKIKYCLLCVYFTEVNGCKSNADKKNEVNTVEVCQKAFMNVYAITEKRVRLQREKLISKSIKDAGMSSSTGDTGSPLWTHDLITELGPLLMNKEILANVKKFGNSSTLPKDIPTKILLAIDNDIAIVSNFFCNQLWKPEYIGCDKLSQNNKNVDNMAIISID